MLKNKELDLAWEFVQFTDRNIFLTGNAGTGKTTFLRNLKQNSHKRIIVAAPTGVAAINAGGVTLHSFFQLPFGPILTEAVTGKKPTNQEPAFKFNKKKINIIKTLDLLVIDEISMVRADMLDAIDEVLRKYRNRRKPFGGVQLLMIGDLEQLAPVVKNEEWNLLKDYYAGVYFFNAKAAIQSNFITIELKHIYRQADEKFIQVLNEVRGSKLTEESYNLLNSRFISGFEPSETDDYIMLTTHNATADSINQKRLEKISGNAHYFKAIIDGNFSEYAYPTDYNLKLKVNAQVMFIKNDSAYEKRYFNGKIGKIIEIKSDGDIVIQCENDNNPIYAQPDRWENIKYDLDEITGEIREEINGTFIQYPLRLAWAITIHKSQGLTFEKAIIDAEAAFAHGQTYVALSRCKTLEGLILSSRISNSAIINDEKISDFNLKMKENQPSEEELLKSKFQYQRELINELFNYNSLLYRLERIENVIFSNQKVIFGKLKENLETIQEIVLPNLIAIAERFLTQIDGILKDEKDAETNIFFKERIQKAGSYFIEQHQKQIIEKIDEGYETDNKEVRKNIEEQLTRITEIFNIRQAMLKSCLTDFSITNLTKARTEGTLMGDIKKKTAKKEAVGVTQHAELYSLLMYWRSQTALDLNTAPNQIMLQKTIIDVCNKLPQTLVALKKVPGIGKVKVKDFGLDIILIVNEYLETKGLREKTDIEPNEKLRTEDKTWNQIIEGKTIEEIAKERGLTKNTIESHIVKSIDKENFNYQNYITKDKIIQIMDYFHEQPESSLTGAKMALGEEISWFELKLVNAMRMKIKTEEKKE